MANAIAISPDDKVIATALGDKAPLLGGSGTLSQVRLWDSSSLKMLSKIDVETIKNGTMADGVAFSPDSNWFAWSASSKAIGIGTIVQSAQEGGNSIQVDGTNPSFSRDSTLMATTRNTKIGYTIQVVDLLSQKIRSIQPGASSDQFVQNAIFVGKNQNLLMGIGETAKIFSSSDGKTIKDLPPHPDKIDGMTSSGDGRFFAIRDRSGLVRIYDSESFEEIQTLNLFLGGEIQLSNDGSLLAAEEASSIKIRKVATGKVVVETSGQSILRFAMSKSGKRLYAAGVSDLWVYDLP